MTQIKCKKDGKIIAEHFEEISKTDSTAKLDKRGIMTSATSFLSPYTTTENCKNNCTCYYRKEGERRAKCHYPESYITYFNREIKPNL